MNESQIKPNEIKILVNESQKQKPAEINPKSNQILKPAKPKPNQSQPKPAQT